MPIQTQCPWCGRKINAGDSFGGKSVKCPNCSGVVKIPPAEPTVPPPAAFGLQPRQPEWGAPPPLSPPPPPPQSPWDAPPYEATPAYAAPTQPGVPIPGMIYDAEDISGRQPAAPPADDSRRPCTACGELIMRDATKCRFCGEVFAGSLARSDGRRLLSSDDEEMSAVDWLLAVLCAPIGCIVSIVYLVQGKSKGGKMLGVSILFCIFLAVAKNVLDNANRQEAEIRWDVDD